MKANSLRHAIALEAARLMYQRVESEYYTAKRKAAKRLCRKNLKPEDLPSNTEIRDLIQSFARLHEGQHRTRHLRAMRLEALRIMRLLRAFRPRLIGSVMTGHVRQGSDIDIHVFTDGTSGLTAILENAGHAFEIERKLVRKNDEAQTFTHIHIAERFPIELTVYPENMAHFVFRSSITGKPIERASIRELEELLNREYPDMAIDAELEGTAAIGDPHLFYRMLLLPLESVRQSPTYHPEGDALYHSLQVFERARDVRPYDEEFLLAALLHDVGKAIDPGDHVAAGLQALEGLITERTRFLIAHHGDAQLLREGSLPAKQRQALKESEDYEDLLLLAELDQAGRVPGEMVGTVDEALAYLRELEQENG